MRRSELRVLVLVEAEHDLRSLDHDRPPDEIGILHHQLDRFLFRFRQRPLLEDRAPGADVVQKALGVDVLLEELARRRLLVDVDLVDVDLLLVQKTSGVFAGRSSGLGVERRLRHVDTIMERRGRLEGC
jgi:hypothetical protein